MAIGLGQAVSAHTTATGATSITPVLAATTAGNLLLLAVTVTGTTNPTITTPTNWTQIQKVSGSTLTAALYAYPNNPGSITSVAVTIGGTGVQGVVASAFEFTGQQSVQAVITSANLAATGTALANIFSSGPLEEAGELIFYSVCRAAATLTADNTLTDWSATQGATASTTGTPNAQIDNFWAATVGPGPIPSGGGTLGASVAYVQLGARFLSGISSPIVFAPSGAIAPGFYQGSIGG